MLSAADVVAMRAAQLAALPDMCSIVRKSATSDGAGGQSETWATVASGVACRLAAARPVVGRGDERMVAGGVTHVAEFVVTLPHGTDARATDRIVISGRAFEVTGIASGSWETALRVMVLRLGGV